jgi:HD superfamily phosphohydrolase
MVTSFLDRTKNQISSHTSLERSQKIYDAVHGFIRFNEWERMLIDSGPFQRLHDIHQLGIAYLVYPGATHTRFEHSLGTMEIATQIFERITSRGFSLPEAPYWLQIVRFAALCHDLGHLPFSHDAEKALLGKAGHEEWTARIITSDLLKEVWSGMQAHFPAKEIVQDVLKMAIGEKTLREMGIDLCFSAVEKVLSQVITGDFFGADRIDYLLRDAQCTGVSYGLFDYHQLIEMLRILPVDGELQLGVEENGVESCDALLLARHFMHKRVYQYSSVKAYKFHLARFMKSSFQNSDFLKSLEGYLSLGESEIRTALRKSAGDPCAIGHVDAACLLKREKRFKAVALKEEMGEEELRVLQEELGIPEGSLVVTDSWFHQRDSFAFTVKISAKREAPDVATFDESIAEGAMDEEKGATDGCLAAGRKLTGKVNEAHQSAGQPAFPVMARSGSVVSAHACSRISVPAVKIGWAYVAPEYEKAFRSALDRWA